MAGKIAFSGVPLPLWWSRRDRVVVDGPRQMGLLYREIKRLNPDAHVLELVGRWRHTAEMHASTRLPVALELFGLLPRSATETARPILRAVDPALAPAARS